MRPVQPIPSIGGTAEARLSSLEAFMNSVSVASHDANIRDIGGEFTATNVTTTREFDADSTTLAEVADVLGTLVQDLAKGGAKVT